MRNSLRLTIGTIALLGVAACGQADATPNADLERDLEQTRVSEFELANKSAKKTDVVSAAERIPTGSRAVVSRTPTPRTAAQPRVDAPSPSPSPSPQVAEAEVAPDTSLTAPRPRSTPQTQSRNRGPYKTVGEIIKNAPFPINP